MNYRTHKIRWEQSILFSTYNIENGYCYSFCSSMSKCSSCSTFQSSLSQELTLICTTLTKIAFSDQCVSSLWLFRVSPSIFYLLHLASDPWMTGRAFLWSMIHFTYSSATPWVCFYTSGLFCNLKEYMSITMWHHLPAKRRDQCD